MQDAQMASLTCLTHSDVELQRAELEEAAQLLEKMQDVSDRERAQFEQVPTVSDNLEAESVLVMWLPSLRLETESTGGVFMRHVLQGPRKC